MKCVIYARYSSLAQNEQSIEEQVKKCQTYATVKQYEVVHTYIDKAKSGSKNIEKRTSFLNMIEDSYKHTFDVLLVYKLDRFSRDEYDTKQYEKILMDNGIRIESATESFDPNTIEGFILKSMLQLISQIMPKQLSPRVKDGMQMNADKFLSVGGNRVLGYTTINKQIVVKEDERPIVEDIFNMYVHGVGYTEMATTLNNKGYRNASGKEFTKTSFYTILSNKKYIGTYIYKGIETPNAIPSIIDVETFTNAQVRLSNVKHLKNPIDYWLSGKIFLEGEKMTGQSAKKKYYYYVAKDYRIKKDEVENKVLDSIKRLLTEDIDYISSELERYSIERSKNTDISRLEELNKDIDKRIASLIKLAQQTDFMEEITKELNSLKAEKQKNLSIINSSKDTFIITKEMAKEFLQGFIANDGSDEFKKNLFGCLVNKCELTKDDEMSIYLNIIKNSHDGELHRFDLVHRSKNYANVTFYI